MVSASLEFLFRPVLSNPLSIAPFRSHSWTLLIFNANALNVTSNSDRSITERRGGAVNMHVRAVCLERACDRNHQPNLLLPRSVSSTCTQAGTDTDMRT
jgi:hypothetical protein